MASSSGLASASSPTRRVKCSPSRLRAGSADGSASSSSQWEATGSHDLAHWQRFPLFRSILPWVRKADGWKMPSPFVPAPSHLAGSPWSSDGVDGGLGFAPASGASSSRRGPSESGLFLRLKERCLLPDYRVTSISGASFEGFYYAHLEFDRPAVDVLAGSRQDGTCLTASRPSELSAPFGRPPPQQTSSHMHSTAAPMAARADVHRPLFPSALPTSTRLRPPAEPPGLTRPPARLRPSHPTTIPHQESGLLSSATRPHAARERPNVELGRASLSGFYFHIVRTQGRSLAHLDGR